MVQYAKQLADQGVCRSPSGINQFEDDRRVGLLTLQDVRGDDLARDGCRDPMAAADGRTRRHARRHARRRLVRCCALARCCGPLAQHQLQQCSGEDRVMRRVIDVADRMAAMAVRFHGRHQRVVGTCEPGAAIGQGNLVDRRTLSGLIQHQMDGDVHLSCRVLEPQTADPPQHRNPALPGIPALLHHPRRQELLEFLHQNLLMWMMWTGSPSGPSRTKLSWPHCHWAPVMRSCAMKVSPLRRPRASMSRCTLVSRVAWGSTLATTRMTSSLPSTLRRLENAMTFSSSAWCRCRLRNQCSEGCARRISLSVLRYGANDCPALGPP